MSPPTVVYLIRPSTHFQAHEAGWPCVSRMLDLVAAQWPSADALLWDRIPPVEALPALPESTVVYVFPDTDPSTWCVRWGAKWIHGDPTSYLGDPLPGEGSE